MKIDIDKLSKLELDDFIKISSLIVVSYAQEKKCTNDLMLNSSNHLKPFFETALENIRDNKIDEILNPDK
jgi:hypothetical protein